VIYFSKLGSGAPAKRSFKTKLAFYHTDMTKEAIHMSETEALAAGLLTLFARVRAGAEIVN
jgi:hypothetical protein